jgi:GT2 family glycosyltransferase
MKKIGIVTVLFKSDLVLEDFFRSISIQTFTNYILYIVDNSPSESSSVLIESLLQKYKIADKTRYLTTGKNLGVAAGNNLGIIASQEDECDYVLLSNNDIVIHDKFLFENMLFNADSFKLQILVPKIYYYNSKEFWFISGHINKFRSKCFHSNNNLVDIGQFDELESCSYAPTCFMLLSKEVFNKVGLMDEKYFVYYDDTDFLWRCKLHNISVNLFTNGSIEHKEGKSTGGQTSDFSFYFFTRNRFLFSLKFNHNIFIKSSSVIYIFLVSLLRSLKYNKTKLFYIILKEFITKKRNKGLSFF